MSKFVWADPDPYGPLTLSGVITPGNRDAVVAHQGKLITVTYTLTRPASYATPKVLKKDWVWENYTLEVEVPGPVLEIKQLKMTPASTSTTQKTIGSTLVFENVPMPTNGYKAYKWKFRFKAVLDIRQHWLARLRRHGLQRQCAGGQDPHCEYVHTIRWRVASGSVIGKAKAPVIVHRYLMHTPPPDIS